MSRVNTITDEKFMPKVVDTILNSNVLATRVLSSAQKWGTNEYIKKSVQVSKNNNGGSFNAFDKLSTAASDTRIALKFSPKFVYIPATIALTELAVNRNNKEQAVVDLAAVTLEEAAGSMADDIGDMFYGDGTGNDSKDLLGLEGIIDDGTNLATYGEQSRTTYTTLNSTVTASGGTLTLAKMRTLYNAITSGSQKPTLGLVTEAVFSLYEQLLEPKERIAIDVPKMKGVNIGGTGFTGLYFKGFPIIADEKCTSGVMYFVNEDYLEFRAINVPECNPVNFGMKDIEGNDYTNVKGLGFNWTGWKKPIDQLSLVGHIVLGGQLWSSNPKRHGKLTGITGA